MADFGGATDALKGGDMTTTLGTLFGKAKVIGGQGLFIMKICLWVGFVIFLVSIIWKYWLRYKERVEIFITSGGKVVQVIETKGWVYENTEDKTKRMRVWKRYKGKTLDIPIVEGQFRYICGKNTDKYFFYMDDNMDLQSIKLDIKKEKGLLKKLNAGIANFVEGGIVKVNESDIHNVDLQNPTSLPDTEQMIMKIRPQERLTWAMMEMKKQRDKIHKLGFFERNKEALVSIAAYGIIFMIYYFAFQNLTALANSIGGGLQAISAACLT